MWKLFLKNDVSVFKYFKLLKFFLFRLNNDKKKKSWARDWYDCMTDKCHELN